MIRALILASYSDFLSVDGFSICDDVEAVRDSLLKIKKEIRTLDVRDSGLGFRCIALRVSRLPGTWLLTGSARLLERPHGDLLEILKSLGCQLEFSAQGLRICSPPLGQWTTTSALRIPGTVSSQFMSAVLLNSCDLQNDLDVVWEKPHKSPGYVDVTRKMLGECGLPVERVQQADGFLFKLKAGKNVQKKHVVKIEPDFSTAFAAAAMALAHDGLIIEGLNPQSVQPDRVGVTWLNAMGVQTSWNDSNHLIITPTRKLFGLFADASGSPDLIPVFSVLATIATGQSRVSNAAHLRFKESDRIFKAVQMARFLGATAQETADGFDIDPATGQSTLISKGVWSCENDHRQAMAALVALSFGNSFEVAGMSCISKSAPELLSLAEHFGIRLKKARRLLIGHRGVGKTTFIDSIGGCDLDREIENSKQLPVSAYWNAVGERSYRQTEREELQRVINSGAHACSLGAGYEWDSHTQNLARNFRKVWIQRASDSVGRIFLDRPRLDSELSPLDEFSSRKKSRDPNYKSVCDQILLLPEGTKGPEGKERPEGSERQRFSAGLAARIEDQLLFGNPDFNTASITIPADFLGSVSQLQTYLDLRQNWKLKYFELRDDYLLRTDVSEREGLCACLIRRVGIERIIWSRRLKNRPPDFGNLDRLFYDLGALCDTDQELKPEGAKFHNRILSSHTDVPPLGDQESFYKWAPVIPAEGAWHFLAQGHQWWLDDVENRVFLPRTDPAEKFPRWTWYRLLTGATLKPRVTFIREGEGSAADQPSLFQWLFETRELKSWGAVVGDPVYLSRSPQFHGPHFFSISVRPEEWESAMAVLNDLGLERAAVTSPLKKVAYQWLKQNVNVEVTHASDTLQSVNTLYRKALSWSGENTDVLGFRSWIRELNLSPTANVVLWGGGGTTAMVKDVFPQAREFSARNGRSRIESDHPQVDPNVLVWAVGRANFTGVFPPSEWRPQLILDLNYSEDSPGREYAQKHGLEKAYISGLEFFNQQALFQRKFWESLNVSK